MLHHDGKKIKKFTNKTSQRHNAGSVTFDSCTTQDLRGNCVHDLNGFFSIVHSENMQFLLFPL